MPDRHVIWFYDGPEVHISEIWIINEDETLLNSHAPWRVEFEGVYLSQSNRTLVPLSGGRMVVSTEKTDKASITFYSQDWTDRTTWSECAIRVIEEQAELVESKTFKLKNKFVIDSYHGKITNEDFLKDGSGNSFRVTVKIDGVKKIEQDPHFGTGGDYIFDYDEGLILFTEDVKGIVTVTYHYATISRFTVKPMPGKKLTLVSVECQFSLDIELRDTAVFQAYGYVIAFAPQLAQSKGGPYPDMMKIPLGNPLRYKSIGDFQNDAIKSYTTYPAIGGNSWRGATQPMLVFDWDYINGKALYASKGMELRIFLEHDESFAGYYATATFYCGSEDE